MSCPWTWAANQILILEMWASCWRLWIFLSLIPKHRAVSLCGSGNCTTWSLPYLEGQDLCVGITRCRWFLPLMLNQQRSCCWDGGGFSRQMEFKLLNSTLWRAMTPCPLNSFLCISVLVLKWQVLFPWHVFVQTLEEIFKGGCWACGTGRETWILSLAFCLNPECL